MAKQFLRQVAEHYFGKGEVDKFCFIFPNRRSMAFFSKYLGEAVKGADKPIIAPQMYTVNPKTGDTKKFNTSAPRVKDWDAVAAQYSVSHRLVWENDYDRHNIHVMVGQDWQHNDSRNFQAYNYGFNDNTLTEFEALTNQTNAQATGSSWKKRMISVYGRLAYTYDDRYMIEGTLRYDGSSNLSRDNRWHMFPSVMVAWNLSREKFFDVKQIDLLKIRASYGVMGSESVSPYSYQMTYDAID